MKNYAVAALTVSALVWQDATPSVKLGDATELAKIEIGRILTQPVALKETGIRLDPAFRARLSLPPWEIGCPRALLEDFAATYGVERDGRRFLEFAHYGDATFSMSVNKPRRATPESTRAHAESFARVFDLPAEAVDEITALAWGTYHHIYNTPAIL